MAVDRQAAAHQPQPLLGSALLLEAAEDAAFSTICEYDATRALLSALDAKLAEGLIPAGALVQGWDNAPHHPHIVTSPRHMHTLNGIDMSMLRSLATWATGRVCSSNWVGMSSTRAMGCPVAAAICSCWAGVRGWEKLRMSMVVKGFH